MCKKLFVLAVILGISSIGFAAVPVVIGDFENPLVNQITRQKSGEVAEPTADGWWSDIGHDWYMDSVSIASQQTSGVTLGSGSLKSVGRGGWGSQHYTNIGDPIYFEWNLINAKGVMADGNLMGTPDSLLNPTNWLHNDTFKVDITRMAADWVNNGVNPDWAIEIQAGTDAKYAKLTNYNVFNWSLGNADNTAHTASMSYMSLKNKIGGLDWVQIIIGLNVDGGSIGCQGTDGTSIYYVDNMQLIPEPATMTLLGLGGLALIRRKR